MNFNTMIYESDGDLIRLTLNRPQSLNAVNYRGAVELHEAAQAIHDDRTARAVIIRGAGRAFCAGIDLKELAAGETPRAYFRHWDCALRLLELSDKLVLCAVQGYALGGGLQLPLACDIRIAGEGAIFSEAFSRMGLIPGDGSCWQLPRLIGMSNTLLLQYTGDRIDGNEAFRLGIASKVVPDGQLMEAAMELATRLAQGPTQSLALIKYLVHRSMDMGFEESLDLAHVAQAQARKTEDHKEAVQAFLEKRPAVFKGR